MSGFMLVINRVVRRIVNVPSMTPGVFLTFLKLDIYCTIQAVSFSDCRNEGTLPRLGTMTKRVKTISTKNNGQESNAILWML